VEIVKLDDGDSVGDDEDDESGDDAEKFTAVLKRYKSLTIENYEEPWKGPVQDP
jgi:hypothetical protein